MEDVYETKIKYCTSVYYKNGWGIFRVRDLATDKDIIIKGTWEGINVDKEYSFLGHIVNDIQYGEQYEIYYIGDPFSFNDDDNEFLKQILTEKQLKNFYAKYDNPLDIIKDKDIKKMSEVDGIGSIVAQKIIDKYEKKKNYRIVFNILGNLDLSKNLIQKIFSVYKSNMGKTITTIVTNPYKLIDDVSGIGWETADKIAFSVGIDKNDDRRIKAYIQYVLSQEAEKGNTWIKFQTLSDMFEKIIDGESNKVDELIKIKNNIMEMIEENVLWTDKNMDRVALTKYRDLENNIYEEIKRLSINDKENNMLLSEDEIKKRLQDYENKVDFMLTPEQSEVIDKFNKNNIIVITGQAGTGKTSVINAIINIFSEIHFETAALAGKASSRIQEVTGIESHTIHRLLGLREDTENEDIREIIDCSIIVDEASMIGGKLFYKLLTAIRTGNRLILVGDNAQLPSIGECNIFNDMIESNAIPTVKLTVIKRQAQKSAIIMVSYEVRNKKEIIDNSTGIKVYGDNKDLLIDSYDSVEYTPVKIIKYFQRVYEMVKDIKKIQIIVPKREVGKSSCLYINLAIQKWLQEQGVVHKQKYKVNANYSISVGDKVINTKNHYDCEGINENVNVFNGYQGIVKNIYEEKGATYALIDFDYCGEVVFSYKELAGIELAYCITVHKSQGSEFDYLIIGIDYGSYVMLSNELLYTALTRAKKSCILCCQPQALNFAIKHNITQKKQTFLKEFLQTTKEVSNG